MKVMKQVNKHFFYIFDQFDFICGFLWKDICLSLKALACEF